MVANPVRLQLSRKRGFNLQELSRATNGLPAAKVTRGKGKAGRWGNPYIIGMTMPGSRTVMTKVSTLVEAYRQYVERALLVDAGWLDDLRGKNLACWCKLIDQHGNAVPCHADVLLRIANPSQGLEEK